MPVTIPAVASAAPPAPPVLTASRTSHGRTGFLIHMLAFAVLGVALFAARIVGSNSKDAAPILGVGLSAAGVFAGWSVLLAFRALWHAERLRWPALVLAFFSCEASLWALYYWPGVGGGNRSQTIVWLGLPLFLPFFFCSTLIAAPLAYVLTNYSERRMISKGQSSWTRRRRWKRALVLYAALLLCIALIGLPWPLFIYCMSNGYSQLPRYRLWYEPVADAAPPFVWDSTARMLENSGGRWAIYVHQQMLESGKLSQEELLRSLNGPVPTLSSQALIGLSLVDRDSAMKSTVEILEGRSSAIVRPYALAIVVARCGTPEQIRHYVNSTATTAGFQAILINALAWKNMRRDCIPILKDYIRNSRASTPGAPTNRAAALVTIRSLMTPIERESFFRELLNDSDETRKLEAADYIHDYSDLETTLRLWSYCLDQSDSELRLNVLSYAAYYQDSFLTNASNKRTEFLAKAAKQLDSNDLRLRRTAVFILAVVTSTSVTHTPRYVDPAIAPNPPETAAELKDLEIVRAAAEKWLKENQH